MVMVLIVFYKLKNALELMDWILLSSNPGVGQDAFDLVGIY